MSERSEGGPAFPQPISYEHDRRDFPCEFGMGGMTLRDYFAGCVLTGFSADPSLSGYHGPSCEEIAERCYQMADAMLSRAREDDR